MPRSSWQDVVTRERKTSGHSRRTAAGSGGSGLRTGCSSSLFSIAQSKPRPLSLFLLVLAGIAVFSAPTTVAAEATGAAKGGQTAGRDTGYAWQEDHAVVAVTVDGHVHTLDAWTGSVRGEFVDSGGPLVSSSTTIDAHGGRGGGGEWKTNSEQDGSDNDSSSSSSGSDDSNDGGKRPHHRRRNALGDGFVVPGLDGVIYALDRDGRLSVLMSSAPDLVLEPRMACLAVSADSEGIVEDESCGLLIGEKTTELFSLDTETGEADRVGGGGSTRTPFKASDAGDADWAEGAGPWTWGHTAMRTHSHLLLQRDEYVVRALDAVTSEELWFVTVAHFSALDLEGKGGPTALTRAKVAAADRAGYSRAVRARFGSEDNNDDLVKLLPSPDVLLNGEDDAWAFDGERGQWEGERGHGSARRDSGSGRGRGRGRERGPWNMQQILRNRFGKEHADRFPYLLYEGNAWVVAMDPMDGSVLWRREMLSLAVSLYGIRGREWVDIMPPPMSLLQSPPPALASAGTDLMAHVPVDGVGVNGEQVDWSHDPVEPLLLLTDGSDADDLFTLEKDMRISGPRIFPLIEAGVTEGGRRGRRGGLTRATSACSDEDVGGGSCTSSPDDRKGTMLVSSIARRPGAAKISGLLQPGLRQGAQLHAQVDFLNGHFFVSSSLRRGQLHAAAEDTVATVHDRYPHPIGMPSRRSFVDPVGRDAGGSAGKNGALPDGVAPTTPPVAKLPPRAARPSDQATVRRTVTGRGGGSVQPGRTTMGAFDGSGGGTSGSTGMGIGDWRRALVERLERDMQEGRSSVGVEVHPDKKGLYMSWRFLTCMAGLVSVIVAIVAYIAYKYGAEAMANMSTITRKGSMKRNHNNSSTHSAVKAELEPPTSGRNSPLLLPPTLNHGASAPFIATVSRPLVTADTSGGTASQAEANPNELFGKEKRASSRLEVHIQRVQSLPAMSQRLSPSIPRDRRDGKRHWKTLVAQEVPSSVNGLLRTVSANTSPEKLNGTKGDVVAVDGGVREQTLGLTPISGPLDDSRHGGAAADELAGCVPEIPRGVVDEVGGGLRTPKGSSAVDKSPSSASSSLASVSSSRRGTLKKPRSTRDAGSGSVESSSSGRRRQHQLSRDNERRQSAQTRRGRHLSEDDGTADDDNRDWSERDRGIERLEQRASRSPRALVAEEEAGAIVVGGGGDLGGDRAHGIVNTGGDAPDALLVANRRLRTEFVEGPKLGRGGFGAVYKCRNRLDGHDYAVKKIRLSSDRRWQQQLAKVLREVKILALLDHPNIVRYYQAWLEKFTEEDEQLLRGEATPSVTDTNGNSAAWHMSTAGSTRASRLNTSTTHSANYHNAIGIDDVFGSAYPLGPGPRRDGDAVQGGYVGAYGPRSPVFVSGGGELRRSDALTGGEAGGSPLHRQQRRRDSTSHAYPSDQQGALASPLAEDLSVDGWSVDSRRMDGRGSDAGGVGGTGWRRGDAPLRRSGRFEAFDGEDDEEDGRAEGEEEEEEDEASMGGFVFDREDDNEEVTYGDAEETDREAAGREGVHGTTATGVGAGAGNTGWTKVDERRPSGSTAPASSYATDSCPNRSDTNNMYASPECGSSRNAERSGTIHEDRGGGKSVCEESPQCAQGSDESRNTDSGGSCEEEEEEGGEQDGSASAPDDDDSFSWHRVGPLPISSAPTANGHYHHRARSTDAGSALAANLASTQLEVAVGELADGGRSAVADSTDRSRRRRGESWPQNAMGDSRPENGLEMTATLRKVQGRSQASTTAFPNHAALRQHARRQSRGRGGQERRGGKTREVYDLWLYIQMQYCSHNNLQYFLEEGRHAQTRVDMPQVMHIFLQVAKGLQYVHACGLIHRDLKPANCFLMADGTVKIGDFGLSRHIVQADGINGGGNSAEGSVSAAVERLRGGGDAEGGPDRLGLAAGEESITGGVGTYLYGSPEQMSGKPYDEKTDMYSLGMLLFEMCHPPFGTKMERTVVLTNAHRLVFPTGDVWGPPKGQEAIKNLCRSMLQKESVARPSAADTVRQVELMQGKHMLLQLEKKPPNSYGAGAGGRPDVAVVLRVEALEQEGLLHRLVDLIRALCRKQDGRDAGVADGSPAAGTEAPAASAAEGSGSRGARLEQYGLRGHTGSAVMEFLIAGAALEEREAIIAALESLPEVKSVGEFPANG